MVTEQSSGLVFVENQIVIPIDLKQRLLNIHFCHSGNTKMTSEAQFFWWPELKPLGFASGENFK